MFPHEPRIYAQRFYIAMCRTAFLCYSKENMGVDEDTPLDFKVLSTAIERAQKTVESRNFQSRKSVLEYDDVMNVQRNTIYDQRRKVLDGEDMKPYILQMVEQFVRETIATGMSHHGYFEDMEQFNETIKPFEGLFLRKDELQPDQKQLSAYSLDSLSDEIYEKAEAIYNAREEAFGLLPNGTPLMRELERVIMLRVVDEYWMDNIDAMDELRRGIGLRAYANTNPVDAYKKEGYEMFEAMIAGIRTEVVRRMMSLRSSGVMKAVTSAATISWRLSSPRRSTSCSASRFSSSVATSKLPSVCRSIFAASQEMAALSMKLS